MKVPFPYSVFFIILNQFCERFGYTGIKTVLSLYLTNVLLYSTRTAKVIYHIFTSFVYFFPLIGAIISDSWLGKFRTILYVSIIYAAGNLILTLAATDPLELPKNGISILGLLLIAIGSGGIKPCASAFSGDQFVLPQQKKQLALFFSVYYFTSNAGSLIPIFLTPKLREIRCFGNESCYSLAFVIPLVLIIMSVIFFGLGTNLYKKETIAGENIVVKVSKCIGHALVQKIKSKKKKKHWLDYSIEKCGSVLVRDVKVTLKVVVLFVPLPMFWTLINQQGSAWTFQAVRMSGDIGFYTILPDQMRIINPSLALILIPLFDYGLYPLLAKWGWLKTSLQRMACSGFLATLAFVFSALISLTIEATDPVLPGTGIAQLRLYNPLSCNLIVSTNYSGLEKFTVGSMNNTVFTDLKVDHLRQSIQFNYKDCSGTLIQDVRYINDSTSYLVYFNDKGLQFLVDDITKDSKSFPVIRAVFSVTNSTKNITTNFTLDKNIGVKISVSNFNWERMVVSPGEYKLDNSSIELKTGGVYTVLLGADNKKKAKLITVTEPNSVNMLLQVPQYIVITAADILITITGLEFAYTQAPTSMKSILQAFYMFTVAVGNLIVVAIESAHIFEKTSSNMFLYSGLMMADMILFVFLANRYKYVQTYEIEKPANNKKENFKSLESFDEKSKDGVDNPAFVQ